MMNKNKVSKKLNKKIENLKLLKKMHKITPNSKN